MGEMNERNRLAFRIATCLQYAGFHTGYDTGGLVNKDDLADFIEEKLKDPKTMGNLKNRIGCRDLGIEPLPKAEFVKLVLEKLQSVGH